MLEALAKDGKYQEAMEIISDYWGAMLDLGATTFWENFTYQERINAVGIDELPDPTRFNIHADGGAHCYIGLRASLCHGWASGYNHVANSPCTGNSGGGTGSEGCPCITQPG